MAISRLPRLTIPSRDSQAVREELLAGPIRGELLGDERLAERARAIARSEQLVDPEDARKRTPLLARLTGTREILEAAHARLEAAADADVDVGPAGEWLLDNYHVVEEHIREVRESLPRGYYRELPELADGTLEGYPRVYELAITLISHTEGRIDLDNVSLFVDAFQEVAPLTVGELWAIPAMLRLGLIESVRRMSLRTVQRLDEVELADRWATRLHTSAKSTDRKQIGIALNDFVANNPPLTPIFVSRLLHQLRIEADAFPPLVWIEQWLSEEGMGGEDAVARATQRVALTQVMTANSITSLRTIARLDWRTFVERQSAMEEVLRADPSAFYPRMTFATRDHYRHVVERIAKRTKRKETDIAARAVELATFAARGNGSDARRQHVGFYLIDEGLPDLERLVGYRPKIRERLHRWTLRHPNAIFGGGILLGTVAALWTIVTLAGPAGAPALLSLVLLALIPASDIGVNITNQLVAIFLPPRVLPKLELLETGGVPEELRTAVVIPTLFGSVGAVREMLDTLEVQFLANREAHLHFAILSDFTDCATETKPDDAEVLGAAIEGVRDLNARYGEGREDAFYLFHRARKWNPQQGVWMGWERKRGKLAQFNQYLRGGARDAFSTIVGDVGPLSSTRYVITLDSDTILPPDAAPLLIGAIAHPLNRAVFDEQKGRVVRGYGIIQPRVGVSLPSAHRSYFAAIHSGHPGVDPYTTAVSDVYQDLYGEGSFTGKGIYDVDAFEKATHGRFPENTLLSHDLIEGNYARAGLATDINVYDDYPTRYLTYTRRKHRWIRGDWQLLEWLTPRVPGPDGPEWNRLSFLSRWKILDNLRRSTVEIAQLLLLVAGWTLLPGPPLRWTLLALGVIAAPWLISMAIAILRPPFDKSWRAYYAAVGRDAWTSVQQVALTFTFLPHQAWVSADAIARTLWRMYGSKKLLLEWQTASQTERSVASARRIEIWKRMGPAVALSLGILGVILLAGPVWVALPIVTLWVLSPSIAHALSAPAIRRDRRLPRDGQAEAMRYALLHWRFFDRFVTAETNWLAPDNFQEEPLPVVAMRTSPTNIGLQLLSTVSAYDLGFLTMEDLVRRLELTLRSLERMRRFKGHFYNWYDLHDLRVLEPAYISTVDSGNLAGHLIAVRQACLAIRADPLFDARVWRALDSALTIAVERMAKLASWGAVDTPAGFQAVATAASHLRAAKSALAARTSLPASAKVPETFTAVAARLDAAESALHTSGLGPDALDPATEWITWSLRLISSQSTLGFDIDGLPDAALVARLDAIASRAYNYAMEMDFGFLFDPKRKLFSIGYQQTSHCLDGSFYDLLASEARLASFVAIAKNDIPVEHWFRLGRTLTHNAGETALVSWSGSMFEYLMPVLVMQSFPYTVLDQTYEGAVKRHRSYGAERDVPWGVSESAYNLRDRHQTYQYRAFGVPDLALKRGLGRDLVIAPYASAMAIMVDPSDALDNLRALELLGALGPYGFRDAVDYTRPDPGQKHAVVHNYMAHHVGMAFVSIVNALANSVWQRRFHADPLVRAAELLLHERIPSRLVFQEPQEARADEALPDPELERPAVREFDTPDTERPHLALLGQLPYTIMVSACGAGYSRFEDLAITRWRADGTRDNTGQFCYVKDVTTGRSWSASHQPMCAPADWYRTFLATDRATFHRADGGIETRTEVAVVPEDSAEVRRVTVTNNTGEPREVELTSYGEIVLTAPNADRAHPAFANLFVETEWHAWCTAITATRRPRAATERSLWCVHVVDSGAERVGDISCETDRARFIGRGRTTREPVALEGDGRLSMTTGAVLDPIFALRTRVALRPGQSASVAFTTIVAESRQRAFELADRYHHPHAAQRALDLAWTSTQVELRELSVSPSDAAVFQEIAGHLLYAGSPLGPTTEMMDENAGSQPLLWSNGVSGDWPILVATIQGAEGLPTLRQLLQAHHYWRRRGMMVDLVILNEYPSTYFQDLHDRVTATIFASSDAGVVDRPGGVFIRRADQQNGDDLKMLRATARVIVNCDGRSLGRMMDASRTVVEQERNGRQRDLAPAVQRAPIRRGIMETLAGQRTRAHLPDEARSRGAEPAAVPRTSGARRISAAHKTQGGRGLLFDNGIGGLTAEGDYEIRVAGDRLPPAPWANCIANPEGGFLVTERGAGSTWAESSYFFRLTPWHNDPVGDPISEVLYLRDEESGDVWCATPAPVRSDAPYTVRHGTGISTFEHEHDDIATRLELTMADGAAVKISTLRVTNLGKRARRLTLTSYTEWVLGALREYTQHQLKTSFDAGHEAILARNHYEASFASWVAFNAMTEPLTGHTADRREFIGRNGTVADPAALRAEALSGTTGAGIDPCSALQCELLLGAGAAGEVVIILGAAPSQLEANKLLAEFRDRGRARASSARTIAAWNNRLTAITVKTPDPAFDAIMNRWSLYQALACRMWGRTALYQSSGAFGFRDQLQDTMAFVYAEPAIAREHIVRAAGRQFLEGDVQHWWHPHSGRGVRTKFSDDLAWLPYVVDHYVKVSGDLTVLDEEAHFLSMRQLEPHEHEVYDLPLSTDESVSVYEHCLHALRRACTVGAHGLPLMGIGDWNDGMNRVGVEGRGVSVWLAWFLATTLRSFATYVDARGDAPTAADLRGKADAYVAAIEANAWDGEWYRRAYFDDGTPLGSKSSDECRIDAIAQSWSVISGAGAPERQARAMRSLDQHLIRDDARLLLLLTPPFDKTPNDPGYIKGYLPGVRENGAQYTHAALWSVLATALRGDGDRAFELYQMINPFTHGSTPEEVETYKVEPYVVPADVYTAKGHLGRGGWTWYTGSASWMYRVGLEAILGFTLRGGRLTLNPCISSEWKELSIEYRRNTSTYAITISNPDGVQRGEVVLTVDGVETDAIALVDDGRRHDVKVLMRVATPARGTAG